MGDLFGVSVAISEMRVLVGARLDDTGAINAGSAYLYDLSRGSPTLPLAKLNKPNPAADDNFGHSVAIDGNTMVIGTPFDDSVQPDKGFVYVFGPGESAGSADGAFAVTPASPVKAGTLLTAEFTRWTDPSMPLSFEVRVEDEVVVPSGPSSNPTFLLPVGTHTVAGRIYDSAGNFSDAGPVTVVVDGTAPVIDTPGNLTVQATGPGGAVVTFSVDAMDDHDAAPVVQAEPASGSLFPIGTTVVNVIATDEVGNESTDSFTVTVVDTTPPVITVPESPLTASTTSPDGIAVTFEEVVSASDLVDPAPTVTTDPVSGSIFPLGETLVTVTASDATGNSSTATFTVEVTGVPLIALKETDGDDIADGDAVGFGPVPFGSFSPNKSITVRNDGVGHLVLGALSFGGDHPDDFSATVPGTDSLEPGESTTFDLVFTPTETGVRTAVLQIASNDPDANLFEINLTGRSLSFTEDSDGDGLSDAAEFQMAALGFDWEVSQPELVSTLFANANAAGLYNQTQYDASLNTGIDTVLNNPNDYDLYSLSQVQALHVPTPLLARDAGGQFTLKIAVKKSTDLENFNPFPMDAPGTSTTLNGQGELEFRFSVPDDAAFFRLESRGE